MALLKRLASERGVSIIMSLHELELAQKVSDKILCVKGDTPERCGTPEEIFSGGYIVELYEIEEGSFCEYYGSVELSAAKGEPVVFVIGGGGSGINTYRILQRRNISFAAGVIHENDLDYPVAKALARELVTEDAFEPVSEEKAREAESIIDKCRYVICTAEKFGTVNRRNAELAKYAQNRGKLIKEAYDIV